MKNIIGDGMKIFRKYQLAVWRSIQNFYSHFTKVILVQYPQKYQVKKVMKFQVLKVESANSTMSGSQSICGLFMIPVTTLIM
jgi:hypothetical protein